MKMTRNYIEYSIDDERHIHFYETESETCYAAAKMYAFDDCYPITVHVIVIDGCDVKYCGWQPGMVYEFYNCETGEIIWHGEFPEWDH